MRYINALLERWYIDKYGFLSFAKKFGSKYRPKILDETKDIEQKQ